MHICLYRGEQRIYGTQRMGAEEVALKLVIKRFFSFTPTLMIAWLIFDKKTGVGEALAVGRFKPKPHAQRKLARMGIGVAPVPASFQDILLHHGPEALRWDSKTGTVTANGN